VTGDPREHPRASLRHLGQGDASDRLSLRLILRLLGRCTQLLRPVRRHLVGLFAGFSLVAVAFVPVGLLLMDAFYTRVLQGTPLVAAQAWLLALDPASTVSVASLDAETRRLVLAHIIRFSLVFAALVVPCVLALYYYQVWILQRVNQHLRVQLLERLQSLSLRFHADHKVGDAIYRMYQDSAMVTQLIEVLVFVPLSTLGRILFCTAVVSAFSPWMGLMLLGLWPPALLLGWWLSRRMRVGFRRAREANSDLTSRIQETLAGIKVIKAYGAEGLEQQRFERDSRAAFAAAFEARSLLAAFVVMLFWITGAAVVAGAAFGALEASRATPLSGLAVAGFSVWTLGLYQYFKVRIGDGSSSLRMFFKTWGRTQDIAIGLDRVFELLDLEPEVQDAPNARPLEPLRQGIRFRGVSFRYQPTRPALEDVSFDARVGSINAIVGPTGSGKTTLMALLLRLFDPQQGRIEIDGVDLRQLQIGSLRSGVAVALQENLLFGTSVRENIRYAVPHADDAAVREAARVACADSFIEALPQGYDTLLGERGTKLSSGQRQRLSIARAVLKDTPILVLDEPTAALDAVTELHVLDNLAQWGRGRLVFIITHRLATIRRADQILVMADGRIHEVGSHEELVERAGGAYRSLVEHESGSLAPAIARALP